MAGRASQCFDQWTWASLVRSSRKAMVRKESNITTKPTTRKPKLGSKDCWLAKNRIVPPRAILVYRPPRVRRSKLDRAWTIRRKRAMGNQFPSKASSTWDRIEKERATTRSAMRRDRSLEGWWRQCQLSQCPRVPESPRHSPGITKGSLQSRPNPARPTTGKPGPILIPS